MSLTEFLLARIAEDEATAKAVEEHLLRSLRSIAATAPLPGAEVEHITRWDPARVLAECEAKRRIVEQWQLHQDAEFPDFDGGYATALDDVLANLASVYADHRDYDPAWRP